MDNRVPMLATVALWFLRRLSGPRVAAKRRPARSSRSTGFIVVGLLVSLFFALRPIAREQLAHVPEPDFDVFADDED